MTAVRPLPELGSVLQAGLDVLDVSPGQDETESA